MPRRIAPPCPVPGCPNRAGQCVEHQRQRERMRGSKQARGYGKEHDKLRADWQRRIDAGEIVWCWRCLERGKWTRITGRRWHLGHDDLDRNRYRGPECVPCNTATAGRRA